MSPFTAWDLFQETNPGSDGVAHISILPDIAGESVVKSTNPKLGTKYSFSLAESDGTSRVSNLSISLNGTLYATPGSTVVQNCPGCLVGDPGAVDFSYVSNAGTNGDVTLLLDGDARSILNGDTFAGNNNGGSDGSALVKAVMDPVSMDLTTGEYTVTLTGIVKGNSAFAQTGFSVETHVSIVTPGCSAQ